MPVMMLALSRAEKVFNEYGYVTIVTSTDDSYHMEGSLHYIGLAVDLRIKHIQKELVEEIFNSVQTIIEKLDYRFQCILKSNHIHIEFDRRR